MRVWLLGLIACLSLTTAPLAEEHSEHPVEPTTAAETAPEPQTPASPAAAAPSEPTQQATPAPDAAAVPEIRIVIDTSGSMKQTDPKNLRIPALKLIVNLLPEGSLAGVWLFDAAPREIVPLGTVDSTWKQNALKAAGQIGSKGLFTHIEAALAKASESWQAAPAAAGHRNIILLTDGVVDVSKRAAESAASRQRIFSELLPKLQQAGAQVDTIALSSQSDQDLMRQIALSTGGWNEVAKDAAQLQRTFLKMFNKAVPHDGLPLKDNQFTVDASIEEFTVLVLVQPGAKPTKLLSPDHREITQARPQSDARWVHEEGFDLITLPHPAPGSWKLIADVDPLNQVLIVTNLKMESLPIPSFLSPGEKPDIAVSFTENGQALNREDFLSLLTVSAELSKADGKQTLPMPRSAEPPGRFAANLAEPLGPGDYTLDVVADGRTFQRKTSQSFKVMAELVRVETREDPDSDPPGVIVRLIPDPQAVNPDSLAIQASLNDGEGEARPLSAARHEAVWEIPLGTREPGQQWTINFNVTAKAPDGSDLAVPLKPLTLGLKDTVGAAHGPEHPADESKAETHKAADHPDWLMTAAIALAINAVMALLAWLGYRLFKRRSESLVARLLGRLSS